MLLFEPVTRLILIAYKSIISFEIPNSSFNPKGFSQLFVKALIQIKILHLTNLPGKTVVLTSLLMVLYRRFRPRLSVFKNCSSSSLIISIIVWGSFFTYKNKYTLFKTNFVKLTYTR